MSLDDLNLEFEDEDEAKKKKSDAVQVDVDLEFHLDSPKPTAPRPAQPAARPMVQQSAGAQVKDIKDARPQPSRPAVAASKPVLMTNGGNALKPQMEVQNSSVSEVNSEFESQEILNLREEAKKTQFDAEVKVQVAEFKTEILVDLMSDVKLMDHQINQLLARIHVKHPDMKQEVLMIKKILADFTTKKRK